MSAEESDAPRRPPPPIITQTSGDNDKISFEKQFATSVLGILLLALTVNSFFLFKFKREFLAKLRQAHVHEELVQRLATLKV
jgi:hypothetical protein